MPLWTISFANLFDRYKRKSGGVLKQVQKEQDAVEQKFRKSWRETNANKR